MNPKAPPQESTEDSEELSETSLDEVGGGAGTALEITGHELTHGVTIDIAGHELSHGIVKK